VRFCTASRIQQASDPSKYQHSKPLNYGDVVGFEEERSVIDGKAYRKLVVKEVAHSTLCEHRRLMPKPKSLRLWSSAASQLEPLNLAVQNEHGHPQGPMLSNGECGNRRSCARNWRT
jgi:hypothetical protein